LGLCGHVVATGVHCGVLAQAEHGEISLINGSLRLDAVKWEAEAKAEKQKSGKAESREVA
jgi:hypothetical protein